MRRNTCCLVSQCPGQRRCLGTVCQVRFSEFFLHIHRSTPLFSSAEESAEFPAGCPLRGAANSCMSLIFFACEEQGRMLTRTWGTLLLALRVAAGDLFMGRKIKISLSILSRRAAQMSMISVESYLGASRQQQISLQSP